MTTKPSDERLDDRGLVAAGHVLHGQQEVDYDWDRERETFIRQAGEIVRAYLSNSAPAGVRVDALRELLNREDVKHALEIARMGRPYSDIQGHLYMNERYKADTYRDAEFRDYGLAHAACVLFNVADQILSTLEPSPSEPGEVTDAMRLDWLETKTVNVRKRLRYGSHDMFWASPDEEDNPSDIRKQIDAALTAAREGGK